MSLGPARDPIVRARELMSLFGDPADFGGVVAVSADRVPEPFRGLLDHERHMTVAMERFHGGAVGVNVVKAFGGNGGPYCREILLTAAGGRVVQFGIVRIDLGAVDDATAERIRAGVTPLGRVLIEANAMCSVGDVALLAIEPGPHLRGLIGPLPTFGRVAGIGVAGRPAVELLEIVART